MANVDDNILLSLNRKHVKLHHVVEAVGNIERAGFRIRHMDVNSYCLYGMPGERISNHCRYCIIRLGGNWLNHSNAISPSALNLSIRPAQSILPAAGMV